MPKVNGLNTCPEQQFHILNLDSQLEKEQRAFGSIQL